MRATITTQVARFFAKAGPALALAFAGGYAEAAAEGGIGADSGSTWVG